MIVDVYTEQHGRVSYMVTLSRSRRAAVRNVMFQPVSVIEFESDYRPRLNLQRMKDVRLSYIFQSLPYNPYKSAVALFLSEFLSYVLHEEMENVPLYTYLLNSLQWLDGCTGTTANFHLVFLMRFSRFMGLYPNLDDYRDGDSFDLRGACFVSSPPFHPDYVRPEEASRLGTLMRMNYETMHLFAMSRAERNRCLEIILEYYRLHMPAFPEMKSLEVLQELFA